MKVVTLAAECRYGLRGTSSRTAMTVTKAFVPSFFYIYTRKMKNKSRKIQSPNVFILFAPDFCSGFLAGLRKHLARSHHFCKMVGRSAETLNILFVPVPKWIAVLGCESRRD